MSICLHSRSWNLGIAVVLIFGAELCIAANIQVSIVDPTGKPVANAVVVATPASQTGAARTNSTTNAAAVMDQIGKEFVPEILVVQTGAHVIFPNSDSVAHQVYSFSAAKRFSLPLYRGQPHPPVIFDQPGIIVLGCNIHDHMVGYIYVSASPYFEQTNAQGQVTINNLPAGNYRVAVWSPYFVEQPAEQNAVLSDTQSARVIVTLAHAPRPGRRAANNPRLRDY